MPKNFKFEWLMQDQIPRKGPPLKEGKLHNSKDCPPGVAEYWIESGPAKKADGKSKKEEKE